MKDLVVFSEEHFETGQFGTVLGRLSHQRNIYFFQSPIYGDAFCASYIMQKTNTAVTVIQTYIPDHLSLFEQRDAFNKIIHAVMDEQNVMDYTIWTNTAQAMPHIRTLTPDLLIYDCGSEHEMSDSELEKEIRSKADLVLATGA